MSTGYSSKPLVQKLGIKSDGRACILNAPPGYIHSLQPLPDNVDIKRELYGPADFIQFFAHSVDSLRNLFPLFKRNLKPDGAIWISWKKGQFTQPSSLNENKIREIGLKHGLVDVKVIAVDEEWSGLKFVYRLEDRPQK